MSRAITKNARALVALFALVVVAGVVGIYILQEQRLRIPFIDPAPVRYNVELANAQAVTPGQGQTAQVSGVEIGAIADIELQEGIAVVGLDIEPEYEDLLRQGSRALLRPRTGLKEMYVQIFPGEGEQMPEGSSIRLDNTLTDVDLDEILAQLDDRTRNYLDLFINGAGKGLKGRGNDIARVFERYGPTVEDLALVNRAVAREREALSSTVTSLAQISDRLAERPEDLTQVVDAGAQALGAFAAEERDLRATVSELAPTLDVTEQTLIALRPFSRELGPTLDSLVPAVRALDDANEEVRPFAREATPIVREEIRPFVREAQPLVEDLAPTAQALAEAFPEVTAAGEEFNKFLNLLAFNPNGREGPDVAGREEGYLFWLAWVGHQGVNLHNSDDANGVLRPVFLTGTCDTLANLVEGEPALESLMNLTPILLLAKQADVRVAGVSVGKVEALELDPEGNRSLATLTIDDEYAPLRSDARAILPQKTLLGETYVELTLGSAGAPILPEDGRLANTQVAPTVEFDELLRIFDPQTRETFRSWQETSAQATMGRARDINDSLGNLPVFIDSGQSVVDVLNDRRAALQSLVRETGTTFAALTENERALQSFIADNARVFEVLGARRDSLAESFQILPTFLGETRLLFDRLRAFSIDTDPLIRDLEPVLEDLQPTLLSLETLSPDLETLFEDVDPLIEAADVGFPPLAGVLRELDPTLRSTGPFLQQLNPILEFLELYQPTVSDFISVGAGALGNTPPEGRGTGAFTNGHALPQLVMLGDQSLPAMTRIPTNRGNAYLPPAAKTYDTYKAGDPPNLILPNWDCANAGGEMPAGEDPGCDVMEPFGFQGEQQRYPGLQPSAPGGRSLQDGAR